ncbi:sigma-70 family RNA polymerase sigma factor [Myxococcota bacterium]|nr:sigma-70 family RNA polymerase sigma factor [Myxococcota bacterium]
MSPHPDAEEGSPDPDRIDARARSLARRGDAAGAVEALLQAHGPVVHAFCLSWTGDRARAADLTRRIFARARSGLAWYTFDAPPRGWLLRIARNQLLDDQDRMTVTGRFAPRDDGGPEPSPPDPTTFAAEPRAAERVEEALDLVSAEDRALLLARYRDALPVEVLVTAYGETPEGLDSRLRFARARVLRAVARAAPPGPHPAAPSPIEEVLAGAAADHPAAAAWRSLDAWVTRVVASGPAAEPPEATEIARARASIAEAEERDDPEARNLHAVALQVSGRPLARPHRRRPAATQPFGGGAARARGAWERLAARLEASPLHVATLAAVAGAGLVAAGWIVLRVLAD